MREDCYDTERDYSRKASVLIFRPPDFRPAFDFTGVQRICLQTPTTQFGGRASVHLTEIGLCVLPRTGDIMTIAGHDCASLTRSLRSVCKPAVGSPSCRPSWAAPRQR